MTNLQLFAAIGNMDDALIDEAETHVFTKTSPIKRLVKYGAIAACLSLVVGIFAIPPHIGGAGGGGSSGEGRTYMSYAGPVFPLSTMEDAAVTATREVNYDFAPYTSREDSYTDSKGEVHSYTDYDEEVIVTDSYSLSGDGTVTAVYPVALSLASATADIPTVTVDGQAVEPELHFGQYTGGFVGVIGGKNSTERVNLRGVTSWEDFATLLASGEYREDAFAPLPTLDQSVTVYAITDPICTVEASNPTLCFQTEFDYSRTNILTFGTNGGRYDHESGLRWNHFSIPEPHEPNFGETVYLIVLGDDIAGYRLQGYADGGCDEGEEIEATATVTRYTSTLGEMIGVCYDAFVGEVGQAQDTLGNPTAEVLDMVDRETMLGLVAEMMYTYGIFSDDPVERYQWCDLEMYYSETRNMGRLVYLTFPLTLTETPVEVVLTMHKSASIDFVGKNRGRDGYDMVTRLGSTLTFTEQAASLSNAHLIEIIDQNFGFDLAAGITRVPLDPAQPHYWMDVRKRETEATV